MTIQEPGCDGIEPRMHDFDLSESETVLVETVERLFAKEAPPTLARDSEPLGFAPELWAQLTQLGIPGMGAPATSGGGGATMLELALVAEAAGGAVAPVPLVDHTVAARAHPDPAVVAGEQLATLALTPSNDGEWALVPAGAVADVVVGLDGDEFVAIRSDPPGQALANHACAPIAHRSVTGQRTLLGGVPEFLRACTEWRALQSASLAGLARGALTIGVAYASQRVAFGRPIAGFQALQHGLADCYVQVEGATLLARKAAWAIDQEQPGQLAWDLNDVQDPSALASMSLAFATETAALTTGRALQYHGAYGVAREYDIQLYYRRARGWGLLAGGPTHQRALLSDLLWPRGER